MAHMENPSKTPHDPSQKPMPGAKAPTHADMEECSYRPLRPEEHIKPEHVIFGAGKGHPDPAMQSRIGMRQGDAPGYHHFERMKGGAPMHEGPTEKEENE